MGASANTPPAETQPQRRHQLAHRNAATAATEQMTLDAQSRIVRKTGSGKNKKQRTIGCEYSWIKVEIRELMILHAAGVRWELCDQFPAAHIGKPPWLTKEFIRTDREIEHHDVVSSGIFAHKFNDKNPREWTKQALTTLEDATEVYLADVPAESNM